MIKLLKLLSSLLIVIVGFAAIFALLPNPAPAAPAQQSQTKTLFWRFLDQNCDGTGVITATGNYTTTTTFCLQPPADTVYVVSSLKVNIEDGSIVAGQYGGIVITNGISIRTQDDSQTLVDFTDSVSVTTNGQWSRFCETVTDISFGAGNDYVQVDCQFSRTGSGIRLNGDRNERLEVRLNDDFSGLANHYFVAQGYVE